MKNELDEVFVYKILTNVGTGFSSGYSYWDANGREVIDVLLDGAKKPIAVGVQAILHEETEPSR